MAVGVDEPRNDDLPRTSISRSPRYSPIVPTMRSLQIATSLVMSSPLTDQNPPALQHNVGLGEPLPLLDGATKKGDGVAHEPTP